MSDDAAAIPVIVGVGQINDRPEDPRQGLDPIGLMEAALREADRDGGGGWIARLESLAVVDQLSFRQLGDVSGPLAAKLGIMPRLCYKSSYPGGDTPILMLNEAARRIAEGEIKVAAVAGGEALRTAAQLAALKAGDDPSAHNALRQATGRAGPRSLQQRYGLTAPVDIYPLYENAGRAAYGQTLVEAQTESGEIWSRFSQVAAENPGAWIRKPMSPEAIVTPSADNRRIAFPYNKLMVANSSVNQGAGFIVTSLAAALEAGVPERRLVYVGAGAAAHEPSDYLRRDRYDRSVSMAVSLNRAMELNGVTTADLDFVELYSCFPCVPKMARRVIGWPVEKPATVFGGLTFGGGPIGNYMSHAVVSMVLKLRESGRKGLLFANGGYATNNHTIVIGRQPFPLGAVLADFDSQREAEVARDAIPPLNESYVGPGTIETYTVLYERDGRTRFGVVVGRSPAGERFLAKVPASDEVGLSFLTSGEVEPVGSSGQAVPGSHDDVEWRCSYSA
ncbi:MAG: acetyl-CoA acetyltransferase [Phenylobacterium sp.]|uniref:acetyl-CoA acetyltransferase n=1 Tax=Phenylobacterium sp. TaxID=1871053 RepID=UPI0027196578|nr:acetyl-CoA acetyltransferase [Phenylobacterium sp.]MDO8913377.1 acetyl-CoA acetyltransferase [Phenylobacterium sp.]MDP3101222.1 acetyl-CoA acetyltransferase [Phenylobacterium sp.]HQT53366.1 acetyl-CoA acetyltransferase [Phenylobacterium sp.]